MEYEDQEKTATQMRRLRIVRNGKRVALIALFLYIVLVLYRVHVMNVEADTAKKVAEIHSIRLTLADVDGSRLPPAPDATLNNATVEGVDSNHNYVRDDVERWIFEQYPNEKERAVWMQYAKSIDIIIRTAMNSETFRAGIEEETRANACLAHYYNTFNNDEAATLLNNNERDIENIIINSKLRRNARDKAYEYMGTYGNMKGVQCDVLDE